MIISSDLDEIPSPFAIEECKKSFKENIVYVPEQKMFYYYLNCLKNEIWIGSKICNYSYIKKMGVGIVRSVKTEGMHIKEGGWHFSYLGNVNLIKQKIEAFSHQEFNNDGIKNNLETRIAQNMDIFGRPWIELKNVTIDNSFPEYIRNNLDKYKYLIK